MSKEPREPFIILLVGARGHGKSTWIEDYLRNHEYPHAVVFKEGVNVRDKAFMERRWPIISLEQYKGGKVIIDAGLMKLQKKQQPYIKFIQTVHGKLRRGVAVIDDAARYEYNDITDELRPLLTDCRRMFVELIFIYHSLEDIPIRLFGYTNLVVLFHTGGNPEYKLNKLPGRGRKLMKAKDILEKRVEQGRKYDHIILKLAE